MWGTTKEQVTDLTIKLNAITLKYEKVLSDNLTRAEEEVVSIALNADKITSLEETKKGLEQDILDLKEEKRRETINIEHATKIILEKNEIEFAKKVAAVKEEKATEIAKVKDEYRDKIEKQLDARGSEMKEMYTDVLTKLTSVTGTVHTPAVPIKES